MIHARIDYIHKSFHESKSMVSSFCTISEDISTIYITHIYAKVEIIDRLLKSDNGKYILINLEPSKWKILMWISSILIPTIGSLMWRLCYVDLLYLYEIYNMQYLFHIMCIFTFYCIEPPILSFLSISILLLSISMPRIISLWMIAP